MYQRLHKRQRTGKSTANEMRMVKVFSGLELLSSASKKYSDAVRAARAKRNVETLSKKRDRRESIAEITTDIYGDEMRIDDKDPLYPTYVKSLPKIKMSEGLSNYLNRRAVAVHGPINFDDEAPDDIN